MISGFLFALPADRIFRFFVFQESREGFDEHSVLGAIYECRESKLTSEQHSLLLSVEQENGSAVSSIISLTAEGLPGSVSPSEVKSSLLENVPIVGKHLDFFHPNSVLYDTHVSTFAIFGDLFRTRRFYERQGN